MSSISIVEIDVVDRKSESESESESKREKESERESERESESESESETDGSKTVYERREMQEDRGVVSNEFLERNKISLAKEHYNKDIEKARDFLMDSEINVYETGGNGDCLFHVINTALLLFFQHYPGEAEQIEGLRAWKETMACRLPTEHQMYQNPQTKTIDVKQEMKKGMKQLRKISATGVELMNDGDFIEYVYTLYSAGLLSADKFKNLCKALEGAPHAGAGRGKKKENTPSYIGFSDGSIVFNYAGLRPKFIEHKSRNVQKAKEVICKGIRTAGFTHQGAYTDADRICKSLDSQLGIFIIDAQSEEVNIYQGCEQYKNANCKYFMFVLAVKHDKNLGHFLWPLFKIGGQHYGIIERDRLTQDQKFQNLKVLLDSCCGF